MTQHAQHLSAKITEADSNLVNLSAARMHLVQTTIPAQELSAALTYIDFKIKSLNTEIESLRYQWNAEMDRQNG